MNTLQKFFLLVLLSLVSCKGNKSFHFQNVSTQNACIQKDGYWYNGKCWADFDDDGITIANIDKEVNKQMSIINNTNVKVNNQEHPIIFFFPEQEDGQIVLITIYKENKNSKTILAFAKEKQLGKNKSTVDALLLDGNLMQVLEDETSRENMMANPIASGKLETIIHNLDDLDLAFNGLLEALDGQKSYQVEYRTNETIMGAGSSSLEVKNNEIHINGELGTRTYHQLKTAIVNHPDIKMVVLGKINGSVNDAVNMHTGRILREAGLSTKVLKNSEIASGGVDLFCAGKERIVEKGARVGIHSWCCVNDLTAIEVPKDHPAHKYQIAYFSMCLGKIEGPKFYFHTLESAPFNDVHWMSDADLQKWKIATKWVEK